MTLRLSMTHIRLYFILLMCIISDLTPIILGINGPHISVSIMLTFRSRLTVRACDKRDKNVNLLMLPFLESTSILYYILDR